MLTLHAIFPYFVKYIGYQCYFLLYLWQVGVREKHGKSGNSQGKWKLKNNGHPESVLSSWNLVLGLIWLWYISHVEINVAFKK